LTLEPAIGEPSHCDTDQLITEILRPVGPHSEKMKDTITVALAGNPNAGKTTIFNALTGARQHVGNWPGVTVEKKEGSLRHRGRAVHVIDLPGTYSLTAFSLEEKIARNFIVDDTPDVVVDVVDASNLERNLYLSVQLLEMGVKMVMALNMMDVADGRGIRIDSQKLSELLGLPVVPTNGKKETGIGTLLDKALGEADSAVSRHGRFLNYGTEVEEELSKIVEKLDEVDGDNRDLSHRWLAVKLLEGDPEITERIGQAHGLSEVMPHVEAGRTHLQDIFDDAPEIVLADARYGFISGAIKQSVTADRSDRVHLSETIDRVLTHRLVGPIILLSVLYIVYIFTFQGSEHLVVYFEAFFSWLGGLATAVIPEGLLQSLIVSGIIDGVGGVLGFTPLIAFMFLAIAILEDTGYMSRIAFMLDRVLRGFGLHGASMLALMVSGGIAGGCAVPGVMATRTMKEPKERLVTILVAPLMNCGAKLPVYALLIGAFFPGKKPEIMFLLTLISWTLALFAAKAIRATVLSGPSAPFVLELPPYRVPTLKGLLIHTWERTWMYVKKAGTVILGISVVLWAMMTFPSLSPEQSKVFDDRTAKLTGAFLTQPASAKVFRSASDLEEFEKFNRRFEAGNADKIENRPAAFVELAKAMGQEKSPPQDAAFASLAQSYRKFIEQRNAIQTERQSTQLKNTIGGRMGVALEWVFSPIGFDWRTNIALVGGFAAKEVVVATLGTAYSLGEVDPEAAESLSTRLRTEPGWNSLRAFTLIMFVMLYAPCFVTLVVIRKETESWRWPLFAMVYTTMLAYGVALVVHTVGTLLGLGVS
jgi:ferrous iron transport protein B